MAFYPIDKILRDVRVALDQNMVSDALVGIGDVDTLSVNDIIRSKVLEGVARVHRAAPLHLLDGGHHFGDAVYWGEMASGWTLLPEDFLRLMVFEMSDWERPVFVAIDEKDPSYALQRSRFKGLRGNAQKPVCAIVKRTEGLALEFYSCKSDGALVSKALYMPYPRIEDDGVVVSERCYPAVVYVIASLACSAWGEVERSAALFELSKTTLI